jgi:hypothetical protein
MTPPMHPQPPRHPGQEDRRGSRKARRKTDPHPDVPQPGRRAGERDN